MRIHIIFQMSRVMVKYLSQIRWGWAHSIDVNDMGSGMGILQRHHSVFLFPFQLITAVVTKNWKEIVQSCDLQNWREALAAVLTYARPDEFAALCGKKI